MAGNLDYVGRDERGGTDISNTYIGIGVSRLCISVTGSLTPTEST